MDVTPRNIAVPRTSVVYIIDGKANNDRYSVECAECGHVETMLTLLGAKDMQGMHRRWHIARRLGLTANR